MVDSQFYPIDRQKYNTALEQVHAAKPYHRYSEYSQKDLNTNILKNEDTISRNSHRIRKLDQAYKKNYLHDIKQESTAMWDYWSNMNYKSGMETHQNPLGGVYTVCDHTHDEERRLEAEAKEKARKEKEEKERQEREEAERREKEAKQKAAKDRAEKERLERERAAKRAEEDLEMANNEAKLSKFS